MRFIWGIKTQVLLITFIPALVISIILGSFFTRTLLHNMQHSLWQNGVATALELAFSAEQGVIYDYREMLQLITDRAVTHEDIYAAAIFDKNHTILAYSGNKLSLPPAQTLNSVVGSIFTTNTEESIRFIAPITLQDIAPNTHLGGLRNNNALHPTSTTTQVIGWVCVEVQRATLTQKKYHVLKTSTFIVLLGLLISALFAIRLGRNVTQPILDLAKTLDKIAHGSLSTRVAVNARAELKILQSGVNTMAEALEKNHERMQQNIIQATQELRDTLKTIASQNAELDTARKDALAASQIKSDFLANMSHEIRTPMNGILGFISLLLNTELNTVQKNYLHIVHQSANSLLKILNDILDISKLEAGKINLEVIQFDIKDCIEEALLILSANAHKKGIEIVSLVYSDVPLKLKGDAFRIKQIITNLVSNAIKFTERGSITLRCMIEDEDEQYITLRINITDTGSGIHPEQQAKLFQAFNQADASITRRHGGTGLGLAICKKIASQMQGEIGVESELGMGSTFWFTCKLEQVIVATQDSVDTTFLNKTILLFETHPLQRLAIKHWLTSWGANVKILDNFTELNDVLVHNYDIDALILSFNYPAELEEAVQAYISTANAYLPDKVIALINTDNAKLNKRIIASGAQFCLVKPFSYKKLFHILYDVIFCSKTEISDNLFPQSIKTFDPSIKILAVDDNSANIKLISAFLEDLNVSMMSASDGYQAVDLASAHKFDLILMDIQMPGLDGIAASMQIKEQSELNKHTPIIALSAHDSNNEYTALIGRCFADYVRKPISQQQLSDIIQKWIHNQNTSPHTAPPLIRNVIEPSKPAAECPTIDWSLALKLAGNKKNLAQDMLHELIKALPNDKKVITKAYKNKDLSALKNIVHRLHGGCCYCGVPQLKKATQQFEDLLKKTNAIDEFAYSCLISAIDLLLEQKISLASEKLI